MTRFFTESCQKPTHQQPHNDTVPRFQNHPSPVQYSPNETFDLGNEEGQIIPGAWRQEESTMTSLLPLRNISRKPGIEAKQICEEFATYFATNGSQGDTSGEMATEDESAMETDVVGTWADVVGRRRRKVAAPGNSTARPKAPILSVVKKPPAILIRPGAGKSNWAPQ
ncbi:hypothetical protein QTP88_010219 [Uroleucon formosanum]